MKPFFSNRERTAEFRHDAETTNQPLVRLMAKKAAQRAEQFDSSMSGRMGLVRQQRAYCV